MGNRLTPLILLSLCFGHYLYSAKTHKDSFKDPGALKAEADALVFRDALRTEVQELRASVARLQNRRTEQMERANHTDLQPLTQNSHMPTLLGIFSDLRISESVEVRRRLRGLLRLHPLVCNIHDYKERRAHCKLIYTFVVGGRLTEGPTMQLMEPYLLEHEERLRTCKTFSDQLDCMEKDMTMLNIRENVHEGKSQTWLAFAAHFSETNKLDFVAKMKSDTLPYLIEFLQFVRFNLPPAPANNNMMVGWMVDKFWWRNELSNYGEELYKWMKKKNATHGENKKWMEREGRFFTKYSAPIHWYPEGHFYLLSVDLCRTIVNETQFTPSYLVGVEDHDIGTLAMVGAQAPIKLVAVANRERFWLPGVQFGSRIYDTAWSLEVGRLKRYVADKSTLTVQ